MPTGLLFTNKICLVIYLLGAIYSFSTSYNGNQAQAFGTILPVLVIALTIFYSIRGTPGLLTLALLGNSLISIMVVGIVVYAVSSGHVAGAVLTAIPFVPILLNVFFLSKEKRARNG